MEDGGKTDLSKRGWQYRLGHIRMEINLIRSTMARKNQDLTDDRSADNRSDYVE